MEVLRIFHLQEERLQIQITPSLSGRQQRQGAGSPRFL